MTKPTKSSLPYDQPLFYPHPAPPPSRSNWLIGLAAAVTVVAVLVEIGLIMSLGESLREELRHGQRLAHGGLESLAIALPAIVALLAGSRPGQAPRPAARHSLADGRGCSSRGRCPAASHRVPPRGGRDPAVQQQRLAVLTLRRSLSTWG